MNILNKFEAKVAESVKARSQFANRAPTPEMRERIAKSAARHASVLASSIDDSGKRHAFLMHAEVSLKDIALAGPVTKG